MTIANGWIDWATKLPGIADKVYSAPNRGFGLVGHSIVGTPPAALARFLSTARDSKGDYTPYAAASVMFINPKSGPLMQMYPVTASTWTSGGPEANTSLWAIESEGGAPGNESEPLNDNQVANLLLLSREFEAYTGRKVVRSPGGGLHTGDTFRQHGEVAQQYGYDATACPSNRYQRFYDALNQEEEMPDPRVDRLIADMLELKRAVFAGSEESTDGDDGKRILKPVAERDSLAAWRATEIAEGRNRSVMDVAASAETVSKRRP